MPFDHAARWGDDTVTDTSGRPLATGTMVTVRNLDLSLADVYEDEDRTVADNPVTVGSAGNLAFYADPGEYLLEANGVQVHVAVPVNPSDAGGVGGGDMTGAEILAELVTVDGAGSLLSADLLDGLSSLDFETPAGAQAKADAVSAAILDGATFTGPIAAPGVTISPPAALNTHITAVRLLGILDHAGPPVAADGTFTAGDSVFDNAGQDYLCTANGSPGTWVAVGSGRVIGGPSFLAIDWTQAVSGTDEDVSGWTVTFTFDGRPVNIVLNIPAASQENAAVKTIRAKVRRSSDSADVAWAIYFTSATANALNSMHAETGPISAWPSDAAAMVVGTSYTLKVNMAVTTAKSKIWGASQPRAVLYVVTA